MSWAAGSTRRWRGVRAYVLHRDGYRCRAHADGWCARAQRSTSHTCTGAASHAHHTLGRRVTGDDPRYIVAACAACNLYIGEPSKGDDPQCQPITKW